MRIAIVIALLAAGCAPLNHDHAPTKDTITKSEGMVGAKAPTDHGHPGMFHAIFERLHDWAHRDDAK